MHLMKENNSKEIEEFKQNTREFFVPYYNKNDDAHKIDHADFVCSEALRLNKKLGYLYDDKQIIVAAYAHDMFAYSRDFHHINARDFILATDAFFISSFSKDEVKSIAMSCFDHRSSSITNSNTLSDIIKRSDKGNISL